MMKKKGIIISAVAIIGFFMMNFLLDSPNQKNNVVFHVTLADPNLYNNGVYTNMFILDKGEYVFRFVPNGSSPEKFSISLIGDNFEFYEDFILEGTSHQTGISEYFTWEYIGNNKISNSERQEVSIMINPNGNVMGSVSVDILEN